MNSSHFYKKSAFTPFLFGISSILAVTQLIIGWYVESLLLSCSVIFYYIIFIFFVRLRKKESLISFSTDSIIINQVFFSWENFQKIEFITLNKQSHIENQIHFLFENKKPQIIVSQNIEQYNKDIFVDELEKYKNHFLSNKESQKKGYSLTSIEKKLNLNYSPEIKLFLENLFFSKKKSNFSFLTQEFEWLNVHEEYHHVIISLSKKISKITSTVPHQINSLVISKATQDPNAILFISNLNHEMRYGTENKVFYYHFDYPEFYPIQITYNFNELTTPLQNTNLLDNFQLIDHETPSEKGIVAIEESNQSENTWNFEYSINQTILGIEISVISNFHIQESQTSTVFQYESIFTNTHAEHLIFFKDPNQDVLAMILQNLYLVNLKFARQAWIQKEKNIQNWNTCFNSKAFGLALSQSLIDTKKRES